MTDYETIDHNTPPTLEEDNGIQDTISFQLDTVENLTFRDPWNGKTKVR